MKKTVEPFICVKNLTVAYGDADIVKNVNFTINRGDIFVIMGMSGCGKSTILRSMIGLVQPRAGHIFVDGVDLWATDADTRSKIIQTFGVSFQSGALFSSMTLGENIALAMQMHTDLSEAEITHRVHEKLEIVGLEKYGDFYPSEISGGMIKRAALARAMALNPNVLFFDEPSAGLDPIRAKMLDSLIADINKNTGTTIVMVTHELESIMTIANNSVYIDAKPKTSINTGNPKQAVKTIKNKSVLEFLTRNTKEQK